MHCSLGKTMRSRIVLSALIVLVASISLLRGQPIETPLPGLVWVPSSWAYNSTLASIIEPNHTGFVLGWNWVAPYSPLGRMMHRVTRCWRSIAS